MSATSQRPAPETRARFVPPAALRDGTPGQAHLALVIAFALALPAHPEIGFLPHPDSGFPMLSMINNKSISRRGETLGSCLACS